jgi:hypothetical protein
MITEFLEAFMIVSFGLSWPMNISKAWKARTTKGTSLLFMGFINLGYVAGIISKIILMTNGKFSGLWTAKLGFAFYIINFLMVTVGICIYFRNRAIENATINK